MRREAKETAEAEYSEQAFRAFGAFADIAARPVLEYLERYKDATGEVSALMKAELRDLALNWECSIEEEGLYPDANLETWAEIRDALDSEPMQQQATN